MKVDVIIPCGGSGSRMGLGYNKLLLPMRGRTLIENTVSAFFLPYVNKIVLPCASAEKGLFRSLFEGFGLPVEICDGGGTRGESVANALRLCTSEYVAVHDGARPFVTRKTIDLCAKTCKLTGTAVASVAVSDSVRVTRPDGSSSPVDRNTVRLVQTPQFFRREELTKAYALAEKDGSSATDDAQLYEKYIGAVSLCDGDPHNRKMTDPSDLELLAPSGFRVGAGWDIHRLVEGRRFVLGGVEIPFEKGLLGHSDADVLTHAVMDAVLGALGRRDIGCLFPDTDPAYEGADSMTLLDEVAALAKKDGFALNNLSATVICERPKLKNSIPKMCDRLAQAFGCDASRINVAATTSEKTGDIGRGEAVAAIAYCSLSSEKVPAKADA